MAITINLKRLMWVPGYGAYPQQIQLWTYNNTQYRGGSANSYYYEWSGGDALRAAAYWMQQAVTPDLGLLHVTRQGGCQWIASDKRLCDQGVQHGDTVILLSTRTVAPTPQLEPEQNVTANASFIIHPGHQPARPVANAGSMSIESNEATFDPKFVKYGVCLEHGRGVLQNYEEAARYYKLSADQGNADAQYQYGFCLKEGRGS